MAEKAAADPRPVVLATRISLPLRPAAAPTVAKPPPAALKFRPRCMMSNSKPASKLKPVATGVPIHTGQIPPRQGVKTEWVQNETLHPGAPPLDGPSSRPVCPSRATHLGAAPLRFSSRRRPLRP